METSELTFFLLARFSGHVQGVGFRYSTSQIARGFEVTGFVKNLADGRVELEVEGKERECRQFLATLQEEMDGYIRKTEVSAGQRPHRFASFSIA